MSDPFERIFQPAPGIRLPGSGAAPADLGPLERAEIPLTDRGNARRLHAVLGEDLVWCPEWGWGVWVGTHYEFDAGEIRAFQICQSLPEIVREEAEAWAAAPVSEFEVERELRLEGRRAKSRQRGSIDKDSAARSIRSARRQMLERHAESCENVTLVDRAMKALRPLVRVSLGDLDADPDALAVANGTVRLDRVRQAAPEAEAEEERAERLAGWLTPPDRAPRPTRVAAARFDPRADCPRFRDMIALIQPKAHMQAYLKRCCGQMIAGRNEYQVALLWQGEGANGKSTLLEALARVLGTHLETCRIEMFLHTEARSSSAATPDEADLPGARVYAAEEPEADAKLSDAKLKSFTGGGRRNSRANYGAPFKWRPGGVSVLLFNRMPGIMGDSYGTRRRLAFVPFEQNLHELPPDRRRTEREVLADLSAELPGILNWLLEGYAEAHHLGGLHPPAEANLLRDAMMSDADPVGEFIKACTVPVEAGAIRTSRFYEVYAAWCDHSGSRRWAPPTVKKLMAQKGYREVAQKGYPHWSGIGWATNQMALDLVRDAPSRNWTGKADG